MGILGYAGYWSGKIDSQQQADYLRRRTGPWSLPEAEQVQLGLVRAPHVHQGGGLAVAVVGDPYQSGPTTDPARRLHETWHREGRSCLHHLVGPFAIAVIDENAESVVLAIDRMGIERMTWAVLDEVIAFGTSAEDVARFPALNASVREQGLYDFLMLHMIPAPQTIYQGVQKLRPATGVSFSRGRAEIFTYWTPAFQEHTFEPEQQLRAELHTTLEAAVRDCNPDDSTGSFLSGGLDSSTVSGKLGHVTGKPARTFSIGFGVAAYDELKYARIAAERFGCNACEYNVTAEDVGTAFPLIAAAYDEPFGNSSAVPAYFCALRAREQGITLLLAGDGGDEIFGGNERYARQQVFDWYFRLPAPLRERFLERIVGYLPSQGGFKPLSKLRSYIEQAHIPLPERLESWNFVYREGATMMTPEFASAVDPRSPFRTMEEVYSSAPAISTLNKMLYYDWYFTLADSDLRKVQTMSALAGVQIRYPMLDWRVVELANRVHPRQKMSGLQLRSFYKRAMRGFLPDAILNKTKHGFGLPFGDWLKTDKRLADLIYSHLNDLKARRIVRSEFLDKLITDQRSGHTMYYGYVIWDLAILEAWLKIRSTR